MNKFLVFSSLIMAQNILIAQLALPVKQLTIFKNQTAFIVKEGSVSAANGKLQLPVPGSVLYGTYWLSGGKENGIRRIEFRYDTLKVQRQATELRQLLQANAGKEVSLYMRSGDSEKKWSGKLEAFSEKSGIIRLTSPSGQIILPAGLPQWAEFSGGIENNYSADSISRVANVWLEKNAAQVSLREVYLQQNFNWIPSYHLRLGEEENARLEMKATIENYAEPIQNAAVQLVVGSPQLYFGSRLDPVVTDYFGGEQGASDYRSMLNNAYMPMAKTELAADAGAYREFATEGEKTEDLYIYKLGNVSVPDKSKVIVPVFSKDVSYRDKYDCSIPDQTNFFASRYVDQTERDYETWHSIEIINKAGVPLTAASIMITDSKDRFLAQDQIRYVPVGAKGDIRLSRAVDVSVKCSEEENRRDETGKKIGKTLYGKVVLTGTITIENFQEKTITHSLKKEVSGEVTKASGDGKLINRNPYRSVNPQGEITWEQVLKPNEKKTLSYTYEVLFPLN